MPATQCHDPRAEPGVSGMFTTNRPGLDLFVQTRSPLSWTPGRDSPRTDVLSKYRTRFRTSASPLLFGESQILLPDSRRPPRRAGVASSPGNYPRRRETVLPCSVVIALERAVSGTDVAIVLDAAPARPYPLREGTPPQPLKDTTHRALHWSRWGMRDQQNRRSGASHAEDPQRRAGRDLDLGDGHRPHFRPLPGGLVILRVPPPFRKTSPTDHFKDN